MGTIDNLLERIKNYGEKIFLLPLSAEEIEAFEEELNIKFPISFRTYLSKVGLFQDLITENIFNKKSDFLWEKDFIDNVLKNQEKIYFGFGANSAGDVLALKDARFDDEYVYKVFHETGKIQRTTQTFIAYVEKAVRKVEKQVKNRKLNKDKRWAVQFYFDVESATEIIEVLRMRFTVSSLGNNWFLEEVTPAGVTVSSQTFRLNGGMITIKKAECDQWLTPNFTFDIQESVLLLQKGSIIEEMDILFRRSGVGYKLIDYGIL